VTDGQQPRDLCESSTAVAPTRKGSQTKRSSPNFEVPVNRATIQQAVDVRNHLKNDGGALLAVTQIEASDAQAVWR
jgi:hypothetical protein